MTAGVANGRLLLCLLLGCAQTDLVARSSDACVAGAACGGDDCRAQLCSSLASQAALCASGSVPALAGDGCSGGSDSLPVSRFAVCSCSDFVSSRGVTIDAFADMAGNGVPDRGSLGVNRDLSLATATRIDGSIELFGEANIAPGSAPNLVQVATAPCQCDPAQLLDIAGTVLAHAQDNENAARALTAGELDGFAAARELSLDCGRYYFTRIAGREKLTIRGSGNLAIYVAGNIELDDALEISVPANSHVSLFVAGEVRVRGSLAMAGSPDTSGRAWLYADSRGTLDLGGSTFIAGGLYAPRAELVTTGTFELFGSLLVRRVASGGELVVHYDVANAAPQACR